MFNCAVPQLNILRTQLNTANAHNSLH